MGFESGAVVMDIAGCDSCVARHLAAHVCFMSWHIGARLRPPPAPVWSASLREGVFHINSAMPRSAVWALAASGVCRIIRRHAWSAVFTFSCLDCACCEVYMRPAGVSHAVDGSARIWVMCDGQPSERMPMAYFQMVYIRREHDRCILGLHRAAGMLMPQI